MSFTAPEGDSDYMLVASIVMCRGLFASFLDCLMSKELGGRLLSLCLVDFGSVILQSGLRGMTEVRPVAVCRLQHLMRIQTACSLRQS